MFSYIYHMEKKEYEKPADYARRHGVNRSRITQLKSKLKWKQFPTGWAVEVCEENAALFDNPSHKRGKKNVY